MSGPNTNEEWLEGERWVKAHLKAEKIPVNL